MTSPYTLKRLTDVEDSAPKFGFADVHEVRFAGGALEAEHTGVSHHRLRAGKRQPFAHRHDAHHDSDVELVHDWWQD